MQQHLHMPEEMYILVLHLAAVVDVNERYGYVDAWHGNGPVNLPTWCHDCHAVVFPRVLRRRSSSSGVLVFERVCVSRWCGQRRHAAGEQSLIGVLHGRNGVW